MADTLRIPTDAAIDAVQLVSDLARQAEEQDANVLVVAGDAINEMKDIKRRVDAANAAPPAAEE